MKNSISIFIFLLISFSAFSESKAYSFLNNENVIKTIILINGEAYLVDLDYNGEILNNYQRIDDYFDSPINHDDIVKIATKEYEEVFASKNTSKLIIFSDDTSILNDVAVDNIRTLASLYSRGVLKNINIIAGQSEDGLDENLINNRVASITQLFQDFGVADEDINKTLKIYRSTLPNQFVKIDLIR